MTDRELLELAARAAGLNYDHRYGIVFGGDDCGNATEDGWNSLLDDGDALRLAVYLEFEIDITSTGVAVRTRCGLKVLVNKTEEPDLCAAARLAITRAAAEIGRQMEVTSND